MSPTGVRPTCTAQRSASVIANRGVGVFEERGEQRRRQHAERDHGNGHGKHTPVDDTQRLGGMRHIILVHQQGTLDNTALGRFPGGAQVQRQGFRPGFKTEVLRSNLFPFSQNDRTFHPVFQGKWTRLSRFY